VSRDKGEEVSEPVHATASELLEAGVDLSAALKVSPTDGQQAADEWVLTPADHAKLDAHRKASGGDTAE
jgi:hypothetical protein